MVLEEVRVGDGLNADVGFPERVAGGTVGEVAVDSEAAGSHGLGSDGVGGRSPAGEEAVGGEGVEVDGSDEVEPPAHVDRNGLLDGEDWIPGAHVELGGWDLRREVDGLGLGRPAGVVHLPVHDPCVHGKAGGAGVLGRVSVDEVPRAVCVGNRLGGVLARVAKGVDAVDGDLAGADGLAWAEGVLVRGGADAVRSYVGRLAGGGGGEGVADADVNVILLHDGDLLTRIQGPGVEVPEEVPRSTILGSPQGLNPETVAAVVDDGVAVGDLDVAAPRVGDVVGNYEVLTRRPVSVLGGTLDEDLRV